MLNAVGNDNIIASNAGFSNTKITTPEEEEFIKGLNRQINQVLAYDYENEVDTLLKLQLITNEEAQTAKRKEPLSNNYLEKASAWERLAYLTQAKAISGMIYCEALEYLRTTGQLIPDLQAINICALEMEKLAWDGIISSDKALSILKEFSQGRTEMADKIRQDYKQTLIKQLEEGRDEGVFTEQEEVDFRHYFSRDDITIMGMPREANDTSTMAWGIIHPLISKLEIWNMVGELKKGGLVNSSNFEQFKKAFFQQGNISIQLQALIHALKRLYFARHKGLIKDSHEYEKALRLLYKMTHDPEEVMRIGLPEDMTSELAAETMEEMHVSSMADPLVTQKRTLGIIIEAWQEILDSEIIPWFENCIRSEDEAIIKKTHDFLVDLNRRFSADARTLDTKKDEYLVQIKQFLSNPAVG